MASVLFFTQPLLLGHGFINQKDTPFMALFLATFITGVLAGDRLVKSPPSPGPGKLADHQPSSRGTLTHAATQWRALRLPSKMLHVGIVFGCLLIALDLVWLGSLRQLGDALVTSAYGGQAPPVVQRLFGLFATDTFKTPLAHYLSLFRAYFLWLRIPVAAMAILAMLFGSSAFLPAFGEWWGLRRSALTNPALWISAVLLGATVCVRQQGIFAGALVTLYLVHKARARAGFPLVVFWTTAAIVTFATWPYLWPAPVERFIGSFAWAVNFPSYETFFEGQWITAETRPWYYLPKLVGLQLTEPAVFLVLIGAGVAIMRLRKNSQDWFLYLLLALWIGVPAFGVMVLDMTVYGNIRHLLFTLPALLAFSAMTFDWLLASSRRVWVPWAVFALAVIPGIMSSIYLHPYEYVYLNSLTGGVSGGYGLYELDHECISLREGIEAANRLVPPHSAVQVPHQRGSALLYARADLRLGGTATSVDDVDFILTCSWPAPYDVGKVGSYPVDLSNEGFVPMYMVRRGNAVLATLWER